MTLKNENCFSHRAKKAFKPSSDNSDPSTIQIEHETLSLWIVA